MVSIWENIMKEKLNRGGRPQKSATQKKNYRLTIKMDTQQYYFLKGLALQSGATMTESARDLICKGHVRERLSLEHLNLIRQLSGMANNLNQIAKQANSTGYVSVSSECSNLTESIISVINMISDDR